MFYFYWQGSRAAVNKPLPTDQIWPAVCFYTAPKLKIVFTYSNGWGKKSKEEYIITNYYVKFKCQCPIKFYWNTVIPIHLHVVYGCFSATTAQLSSCERDHLAYTKIFTMQPFTKTTCPLLLQKIKKNEASLYGLIGPTSKIYNLVKKQHWYLLLSPCLLPNGIWGELFLCQ